MPQAFTPDEAEAWFASQPRPFSAAEAEAWFASHPRAFSPEEAEAWFAAQAGGAPPPEVPQSWFGQQAGAPSVPSWGPPPSLPGEPWSLARLTSALLRRGRAAAAGSVDTRWVATSTVGGDSEKAPAAPGHFPESSFTEDMRDALRRAPWMLFSLAMHALLMAVLANMVWLTRPEPIDRTILSAAMVDPIDIIPEAPPELPVVLEDIPIQDPDVELELEEEMVEPIIDEVMDELAAPFEMKGLEPIVGTLDGSGGFRGKYRKRGTGGNGRSGAQRAVGAGLDWLHRHQQADGSWNCDGFSGTCAGKKCDGGGNGGHDVGVTALALLAFLGSGNTISEGVYKENVRIGLRWLQKNQDRRTGCFGPQVDHHFLYGHALATLAMTEAYHLSGAPVLKDPAQRGLHFIARSRNPYSAWRYASPPNGDDDSSVTGWMLFALFAGRDAGLFVDDSAIRQGMAYLDKMTHPTTFRTGYHQAGQMPLSSGEAMTAVAMLLRVFHGEGIRKSVAMKKGAELLADCLPRWDQKDYYYWYYASYAMWQLSGTYWSRWQTAMLDALVKNQRDGRTCNRGSWDPQGDSWGSHGGRVYSTALCTLSLQVYYRYDRVLGSR